MQLEIEANDIDGLYQISESDDHKWYITRFSDMFRNGGQDCTEYEHDYGFATKQGAKRWVERNLAMIINDLQKDEDWMREIR